jgi:hypothetical protein
MIVEPFWAAGNDDNVHINKLQGKYKKKNSLYGPAKKAYKKMSMITIVNDE